MTTSLGCVPGSLDATAPEMLRERNASASVVPQWESNLRPGLRSTLLVPSPGVRSPYQSAKVGRTTQRRLEVARPLNYGAQCPSRPNGAREEKDVLSCRARAH
jgi:hypothetical protein